MTTSSGDTHRRKGPDTAGDTDVVRTIHEALRIRGLSVRQAASKAGLSGSAVAAWQRGDRRPTAAALLDFLTALGFDPTIVLDAEHMVADLTLGTAARSAGWAPPTDQWQPPPPRRLGPRTTAPADRPVAVVRP